MNTLEPRAKWYHLTKGNIIALLFLILLLPFAAFVGFFLWMVVHPNDTLVGVGVEEVSADQASIEVYVNYDQNSEMDPNTYSSNAITGIKQMLAAGGMDGSRMERPYDSSLKVNGFSSENNFAELTAVRSHILERYPTAQITTHYRYTLTPQAKADALVKAINNAKEQADTLAAAQGRKVIFSRSTTCHTSVIDSTQTFNPQSCGDTPVEDQITDTSPLKHIIATVNASIVFSF